MKEDEGLRGAWAACTVGGGGQVGVGMRGGGLGRGGEAGGG